MKKCISILFASALVLSLFAPCTVTAANLENKTFGDYVYVVLDDEVSIINVDVDISGEVVIPTSIEGYPVTSIGERAFDKCNKITTLKIPAGVTYIAEAPFEQCTSLTKFIVAFGNEDFCARDGVLFSKDTATLICYPPAKPNTTFAVPDCVEKVDVAAFAYTPYLEEITVADSVQSLGDHAFYQAATLKQITFGTGLTKIGAEAFAHCDALTSITIPNSVTSVGMSAFAECGTLSDVTFGRGLTSLSGTLFLKCTALKTIALPDNVTAIGSSAFSGCSGLESILISESVTRIGAYAFFGCDNLKTISYTGAVKHSDLVIGSKNDVLTTAQWQYDASPAMTPAEDTSVGPQPISGPDSNVIWGYVMIGGLALVLAAAIAAMIIWLVKGIKQRK